MAEMRFDGRVAIVTGAGSAAGLGRAHAMLLASRGARVVVNDLGGGPDGLGIERSHADLVAGEIRALGGEAVADVNSVASEESALAVVGTALERFGRVDLLVNNAGIVRLGEFGALSSGDIRETVDVHLMGNVWMCRAVWGHMVGQDYGRIVNVTSIAMWGAPNTLIYGAAKAGILGLTRGLAFECSQAGRNIKVNALAPHANTTAAYYFNEPTADRFKADRPPEAVAACVGYLCHEDCGLNGAYVASGVGHTAVGVFGVTAGFDAGTGMTPEDVRDNLGAIVDPAGFEVFPENPIAGLVDLKDGAARA